MVTRVNTSPNGALVGMCQVVKKTRSGRILRPPKQARIDRCIQNMHTNMHENNIEHDALIYISDLYIEDVKEWPKQPTCRTMWLSTQGAKTPDWDGWRGHRVYPLNTGE